MDLRKELMRRLAQKERIADLARDYGVSRKTINKFVRRFEKLGPVGLEDQSRAPKVIPHKTPPEVEEIIVAERRQHPTWGGKKLKEVLERRLQRSFPAASAITAILGRHGLLQVRKKRQRYEPRPTTLREASAPNDTWCIDYKGQFRLGDQTYCYPLTITDQFSRFILGCEGMSAISDEDARDACEEVFRTHGLPTVMRSDNGVPFASTGLAGLTQLSVFWLRLGILLERTRPAHPEDNGRHERMHRTLKFETARPARSNLLQQQERFDEFVHEFNNERPHEALEMKRPAHVYTSSSKPFPDKLPELRYLAHDDVVRANAAGQVYVAGVGQVALSIALARQQVGLREERDGRWLITFAELDLGHVGPGRTNKRVSPCSVSNPPEAVTV